MAFVFNFNIDVDVFKIFECIGAVRSSYKSEILDNGNGRWISCQENGQVISACYHKTKNHSATVETGGMGPFFNSKKSTAGPGEWAVAIVGSRGWDRTYYNF